MRPPAAVLLRRHRHAIRIPTQPGARTIVHRRLLGRSTIGLWVVHQMLGPLLAWVLVLLLALLIVKGRGIVRRRRAQAIRRWPVHDGPVDSGRAGTPAENEAKGTPQAIRKPGMVVIRTYGLMGHRYEVRVRSERSGVRMACCRYFFVAVNIHMSPK